MTQMGSDITALLQDWQRGEPESLNKVIAEVYGNLKKMAAYQLANESPSHTIQPTALVNEAYLKLVANSHMTFPNRKCFFLFVAMLMRRILVEYARAKMSRKRGGGRKRADLEMDDVLPARSWDPEQVLDLDEALGHLKKLDPRKYQFFEMWFFVGLDAHEIGDLFAKSPITIRRDLRTAKCWLARTLERKTGRTVEGFF